jgi:hypothetical protein
VTASGQREYRLKSAIGMADLTAGWQRFLKFNCG